ncbi:MAG TPA: hypothetical protein VHQ66_08500, partial [Myxococcota bacterium]|nr:hypothetical protein [Myxococcota bacterium]
PQLRVWSPPDSLIAWTVRHHRSLRARYEASFADPALAHLRWHRLRSPRALTAWSHALALPSGPAP